MNFIINKNSRKTIQCFSNHQILGNSSDLSITTQGTLQNRCLNEIVVYTEII